MENSSDYSVRELNPDDAEACRTIRLHALRYEGELFGPTYEDESELTAADWQDRLNHERHPKTRYFGLFNSESMLIGITRAMPYASGTLPIRGESVPTTDSDAKDTTCVWGATYLLPEYRGNGRTKPLYIARERWTIAQAFKEVVLFIHCDNARSNGIHVKNEAALTGTYTMNWKDREPSQWNFYRYSVEKLSATSNAIIAKRPAFGAIASPPTDIRHG